MTQDPVLKWRDGSPHRIGPLTLRHTHYDDGGPTGECTIESAEGELFLIDWMDAEAIAFCIEPTADLWGAYESDQEKQKESGARRGWLRLKMTADPSKLGSLTGWKGHAFQVARLVLDAHEGQKVARVGVERSTDYRRRAFRVVDGPAKSDTRMSFIQCCGVLARSRIPNLDAEWERIARGRFEAADAFAELTAGRAI